MVHEVVKTLPVPDNGLVLKDQIIRLTSRKTLQAELPEIRRLAYRDPETVKVYVFLANHRRWAAQTVADIYTSRWEVELFLKWTKWNRKIRNFLGYSMNAVASRIFVALNVYLLVASRSASRARPWASGPSYAWCN